MNVQSVALFCEDIRAELSGLSTVIGVMPDTMSAPEFPIIIPKLTVYFRFHFDPASPPKSILPSLTYPDGSKQHFDPIDPDLIKQSSGQAAANGSPLAGVVSTIIFSPFTVVGTGAIRAIAVVDEIEVICGSLNSIELIKV